MSEQAPSVEPYKAPGTDIEPYVAHSAKLLLYEPPITTLRPEKPVVQTLPEAVAIPGTGGPEASTNELNHEEPQVIDEASLLTYPFDNPNEKTDPSEILFSGKPVKVRYAPTQYGAVQLGLEFTRPGDVMDWSEHEPQTAAGGTRNIILTTQGGTRFYVRGNHLYDLALSEQAGHLVAVNIDKELGIPRATIGEYWQVGPDFSTDPISKVEVRYGTGKTGGVDSQGEELNSTYRRRGKDPFRQADILRLARTATSATREEIFGDNSDWIEDFSTYLRDKGEAGAERLSRAATLAKNLGATALHEVVDYAGSRIDDFQEWFDQFSDDMKPKLQNIAARLRYARSSGAERLSRAATLVNELGRSALAGSIDRVRGLPAYLQQILDSKANNEDAIRQLSATLLEGRAQPADHAGRGIQRGESASGEAGAIKAHIEAFNEKLQDPAYVPSPSDYRTMQELDGHIRVTYSETRPDLSTKDRINYVIVGEGTAQISPYAARSFRDAVRSDRWKLSDEDVEDARVILGFSENYLSVGQNGHRQLRQDFLDYDEYERALQRKDSSTPLVNLYEQYRGYLQQRLALNSFINSPEADQPAVEKVLTQERPGISQVGMRYLKSFIATRKAARQRRKG
jgi:hypothetical protein